MMFDFLKIGEKIRQVKEELEAAQKALAQERFEAEAGGGLVRVSVRGDRRVQAVVVDPQLLQADQSPEMMQDLVVAATNLALEKAEAHTKAVMKEKTAGVLPQIPGLDISSFF